MSVFHLQLIMRWAYIDVPSHKSYECQIVREIDCFSNDVEDCIALHV